jgi:signal peptidase
VLLGLGAGLLVATTGSKLVGYPSLTVLSGSMEPAVGTGDVVFGMQISARDARAGEVITFREPGESRLITHRLVTVRAGRAKLHMVTKGDANKVVERWSIPPDGRIGRVAYRVPKLGYALAEIRGSHGRLLLLVVPAVLLAIYELTRIWRPRRKPMPHESHV